MSEKICPFCGASLVERWIAITPGLVKVLVKCYENVYAKQKNLFEFNELTLNHTEYANYQKLRFHALIAKHKIGGEIIEREWVITRRGFQFLRGEVQIPAKVKVFRNRVIDHDDQLVTVTNVMANFPYWEKKFDYTIFDPKQETLI